MIDSLEDLRLARRLSIATLSERTGVPGQVIRNLEMRKISASEHILYSFLTPNIKAPKPEDSRRDLFIAASLTGLCSIPENIYIAKSAIEIADEILKELDK